MPKINGLVIAGTHSKAEIEVLFRKQRAKCVYCDNWLTEGFHKDHKVPLCRGGRNDIANIQLLCPKCNLSKGSKTHKEYNDENT